MTRAFLSRATFVFEHVFGPDSSSADLYTATVAPLVRRALAGYSAQIVAIGPAGSGKSSILGTAPRHAADDGLSCMRLALDDVFAHVARESSEQPGAVWECSFAAIEHRLEPATRGVGGRGKGRALVEQIVDLLPQDALSREHSDLLEVLAMQGEHPVSRDSEANGDARGANGDAREEHLGGRGRGGGGALWFDTGEGVVRGMSAWPVGSTDECLELVQAAEARRGVGRSHVLFRCSLARVPARAAGGAEQGRGDSVCSSLSFVEVAAGGQRRAAADRGAEGGQVGDCARGAPLLRGGGACRMRRRGARGGGVLSAGAPQEAKFLTSSASALRSALPSAKEGVNRVHPSPSPGGCALPAGVPE